MNKNVSYIKICYHRKGPFLIDKSVRQDNQYCLDHATSYRTSGVTLLDFKEELAFTAKWFGKSLSMKAMQWACG